MALTQSHNAYGDFYGLASCMLVFIVVLDVVCSRSSNNHGTPIKCMYFCRMLFTFNKYSLRGCDPGTSCVEAVNLGTALSWQ